MDKPLITVVELSGFARRVTGILTDDERQELIESLAANPTAGDLIPGGGGLRKLRFGARGKGTRGGARVIHYFADDRFPVFLVDIFAKNEASDYTPAGLAAAAKIAKQLIRLYERKSARRSK